MIVVADTSPLNYLVLLGHIGVLANIYAEVLVPQTVLALQATNFHVAPDLIELLLANDAKRRKPLPPAVD
jgi:predicted nucleic acid-binding protein